MSRIILGGDAAHIHAVNGGQGLNTGNADAFALAWRLNLAIRSNDPQFSRLLLHSYDEERRRTAETVVDVAGKLVRSTLRTAQEYVDLIEKSAANVTGMGIVYPPNSLTTISSTAGPFVAGARFPDIVFIKGKVATVRLYELARYGKFLVFNSKTEPLSLPDRLRDAVEVWQVSREDDEWTVTTAVGAVLKTDIEFPEQAIVVMRPDFYVGYAGEDGGAYFQAFAV